VAILLALLFVTLPFVVRAVSRSSRADAEAEEAAHVWAHAAGLYPAGRPTELLPALLSGGVLGFARALGEYGVRLSYCREHPILDPGRVRLHLRRGRAGSTATRRRSRSACSSDPVVLFAVDLIQRRWSRMSTSARPPLWLRGGGVGVSGSVDRRNRSHWWCLNAFSDGVGTSGRPSPDRTRCMRWAHAPDRGHCCTGEHAVRRAVCAAPGALQGARPTGLSAAINLPFALSPVVIGLALLLAYGSRGWLGPVLNAITCG